MKSTEKIECPYCGKEVKPRGMKSHIRLSSGDGHGDSNVVPDDAEQKVDEARQNLREEGEKPDEEAVENDDFEVQSVTSEDLAPDTDAPETAEDENESEGSNLPFDPSDDDVFRLDGGEQFDLRVDGEILPGVEADEGDYLLKTEEGPVLYDGKTGDMYEVITE